MTYLIHPHKPLEAPWPTIGRDVDEDGAEEVIGSLAVGWDVSFGCRINFGPSTLHPTRVSVHVSDYAKRDGIAVLDVTPGHLRMLAHHLLAVAAEAELHPLPAPTKET